MVLMRSTVRTRIRWGLMGLSFSFFLMLLVFVTASTGVALLLEAKRTSKDNTVKNLKALYIGISYVVVVRASQSGYLA